MSLYENVFIARQDITPGQVDALAEQFSDIIRENGGSVSKKEYWGLRTLAYRIKKNRKGHYILLNIDAPSAAIQEMERLMRINEDILRFLTVSVEELEEGPSAVMRQGPKEEKSFQREDRFGRDDRGSRRPYLRSKSRDDQGGREREKGSKSADKEESFSEEKE